MRIVDCARYQVERADPLDLAKAQAAGITAVNIALDRGRSQDVLSPWARGYADKARELGLGISNYRWLDARQTGAEHARRAIERIQALGGPDGMAHAVDCEDNADLATLTAYVQAMQDWLQRPVAIYTGRWWLRPRGWNVADLSPHLWAAPSAGYLPTYPGDESPHWQVDYGGHTELALMQWGVQPLPGTGECSLTAVRDPNVWAALTGTPNPEGGTMPTYAQLQAESWWGREITTPEVNWLGDQLCAALGIPRNNFGCKGDNRHLNGGHRSQEWIVNSRYCTNRSYATETGLTGDQARHLSAFDITPATRDQMLLISRNIDKVTRAGQLEELVEWFGNTDNDQRVDGWNNIKNAVATSDSSHLWHLHGRFSRKVLRDPSVMQRTLTALLHGTGTTSTSGADMPLTSTDLIAIWTHDLVDGPNVEHAYKVLLRAADGVTALKAEVAELKAAPPVDPAAVAAALAANPAFIAAFADAVAAKVKPAAGTVTAAEVRQIVDEELDEQSRGGADTDPV